MALIDNGKGSNARQLSVLVPPNAKPGETKLTIPTGDGTELIVVVPSEASPGDDLRLTNVAGLQQMLVYKKPFLEKTRKEVGEMMIVIAKDKADSQVVSETVAKEEAEATIIKAAHMQAIKDDAQHDLDEALPALEIAVQCLKRLKADHIREVKTLANPPSGVRLACEAVCVMFGMKPVKKNDPNMPGKNIEDYWETSQQELLSDPKKLLNMLFEFDKDNIPDKVISTMKPYIEREDFDPVAIKKASILCEALCMWVRAMYKYHFVAKAVEPKRKMLREAEEELRDFTGKCCCNLEHLWLLELVKVEIEHTSDCTMRKGLGEPVKFQNNRIGEMENSQEEAREQVMQAVQAIFGPLIDLSNHDIAEMNAYAKPPEKVMRVAMVVLSVLQLDATSWTEAKNVMGSAHFVKQLEDVSLQPLSDKALSVLGNQLKDHRLLPSELQNISKAGKLLCEWLQGLVSYARVLIDVKTDELQEMIVVLKKRSVESAKNRARKDTELAEKESQDFHAWRAVMESKVKGAASTGTQVYGLMKEAVALQEVLPFITCDVLMEDKVAGFFDICSSLGEFLLAQQTRGTAYATRTANVPAEVQERLAAAASVQVNSLGGQTLLELHDLRTPVKVEELASRAAVAAAVADTSMELKVVLSSSTDVLEGDLLVGGGAQASSVQLTLVTSPRCFLDGVVDLLWKARCLSESGNDLAADILRSADSMMTKVGNDCETVLNPLSEEDLCTRLWKCKQTLESFEHCCVEVERKLAAD